MNAIGTQLFGNNPIWRLTISIDIVVESGTGKIRPSIQTGITLGAENEKTGSRRDIGNYLARLKPSGANSDKDSLFSLMIDDHVVLVVHTHSIKC